MTVAELIAELSKRPPDMKVVRLSPMRIEPIPITTTYTTQIGYSSFGNREVALVLN